MINSRNTLKLIAAAAVMALPSRASC